MWSNEYFTDVAFSDQMLDSLWHE